MIPPKVVRPSPDQQTSHHIHTHTHAHTHTHTHTQHTHTTTLTQTHTAPSKSPRTSRRPVLGPDFDVELYPMEIRTFEVEFKFN